MEKFHVEEPSGDEAAEEDDVSGRDRGHWANQLDYLMSILGSIVGYGNLWRFPYLCNRNGGGAFLIPFLFFLVTCGLPLFFLEVSLGQFVGKSNAHIWSVCPLLKGVGVGQFIACSITIVYYQNIIGWSLYYLGMSFSTILPWTSCTNEWNTELCSDAAETLFDHVSANTSRGNYHSVLNETAANMTIQGSNNFTFAHTDVEEFWQYKTLGKSEGVHAPGRVQWHLALSLFASWLLIFLCLIKGVRSVGKVVYVTALLPYVLLIALFVRTLLLPGAVDGVIFYLSPDFSKLLELQVWLEALIQVFYSLSPGWGVLITLSSYNRFHDNSLRNSIVSTFAGEGTSLFCGLVIFTVLGSMANRAGVGVSEVASSGPGLGFVVYPEGLSELPLPQLWAFLFFFMMVTVGLDSQFTWAETLITNILDQFPRELRTRRVLVTGFMCMMWFLMGLPFTTQGGIYYFQILDWYIGLLCIVTFAVLECIAFIWIYGAERFGDDVELMIGRRVPLIFNILLGYITPSLLSIALLLVLMYFKAPTYGDYEYPSSCRVAGWIVAILPVIPIPVMAAVAIYRGKGTLRQRISQAMRPAPSWKPVESKYHKLYSEKNSSSANFSCLNPCQQ